jgi:hypothetical protein
MATLVSRGAMHTGEVPISKHGGEDFASWPLSRYGHYTIRPAYQLARSDRVATDRSKVSLGVSSVVLDNSKIWKKKTMGKQGTRKNEDYSMAFCSRLPSLWSSATETSYSSFDSLYLLSPT